MLSQSMDAMLSWHAVFTSAMFSTVSSLNMRRYSSVCGSALYGSWLWPPLAKLAS